MKTNQTVEDVRKYFDVNYGYVDLGNISDETINEFLNQGYIINLSFEVKMDCLYDYILSQDLCGVEE
jgi:hypothetical protein